jgi:hypothetical protein
MIVIMFAVALSFALTGAGSLIASATSPIKHANPNFFPLVAPSLITADQNNVYIFDSGQLVALNINGNLIKPEPFDLPVAVPAMAPLFIKHAGSFIFVFEASGFSTFTFNNTARTFALDRLRVNYRTSSPTTFSSFDVTFTSGQDNPYRVFFGTAGSASQYGWSDFNLTSDNPQFQSDMQPFGNITDVVATSRTNLLVCVYSGGFQDIHQITIPEMTSERVNRPRLPEFDSLAIIPGGNLSIYINEREGLTLFDRVSGEPTHSDNPVADPSFPTGRSRRPISVASTSASRIFVIDYEKRSVDRYIVINGNELQFNSVIAGFRGGDRGFFNNPSSLTLVNSAMRKGNDITSSEYIVTDQSGQVMFNRIDAQGNVTSRDFFHDTAERLSPEGLATYDNFNTVYVYDYDSGHRVRAYSLDGRRTNQAPFTGFGGRVNRLFADTARNVYAVTNSAIYKLGTSDTVPLSGSFQNTQINVVYHEHLNSVIITNGDEVCILSLDPEAPHPVPANTPLTFAHNVIDITTDIDGNLIILSFETDQYYASVYEFDKTTRQFATDRLPRQELVGASIDIANTDINRAFTFDRINRRLLLIGKYHSIEAFDFGEAIDHNPEYHEDWKDTSEALPFVDEPTAPSKIFLRAVSDTIVYQYPNGTRALALATAGSIFKVLAFEENPHFVLFENAATGESVIGYVSKHSVCDLPGTTTNHFYTTPSFVAARVIFNNTAIFKFPTADRRPGGQLANVDLTFENASLAKNFEQGAPGAGGLRLRQLVNTTDVRGFSFYEIQLGWDSASNRFVPSHNGDYVGYINANNVINYNLGPSNERFVSNATIRLPSNRTDAQVFELTNTGSFEPIEGLLLGRGQAIRVVGPTITSAEGRFTRISFHDPDLGESGHTFSNIWVRDDYIVMNGLSPLQLIAIIALTILVIGGVTFIVIRTRKKRS